MGQPHNEKIIDTFRESEINYNIFLMIYEDFLNRFRDEMLFASKCEYKQMELQLRAARTYIKQIELYLSTRTFLLQRLFYTPVPPQNNCTRVNDINILDETMYVEPFIQHNDYATEHSYYHFTHSVKSFVDHSPTKTRLLFKN